MFHDPRRNGDLASDTKGLAGAAAAIRFALTETEIGNGCREIEVGGELDLAVCDRLRTAIADCQAGQILINLEPCRFIDSSGLAVIVDAHRAGGSRVVVHSPRDQVLRVFQLTGLTATGLVFADRERALATQIPAAA